MTEKLFSLPLFVHKEIRKQRYRGGEASLATTMMNKLLLLLLLFPSFCLATITLTATGEHFASRPDHTVGTHFLQGFEYLARLQVFSNNLDLCPEEDSSHVPLNLTVVVPPDGLPVAILARNTGCSVETKARLASYSVEPPHKLRYLILYGDEGLLPEEPFSLYRHRDMDITVGILHVSERSGNELLWTISNQSRESKLAGGPRLLLDGSDSSKSQLMRDLTLWMGIGVMMMACMFSFFLSVRAQQGAFRSAPLEAPRRERPQRLSMEQVQELVPEISACDYHCFDADVESHHAPEICSICLDEYSPSETLAELPCGHVFHSDCIGKWLTERSSTCPLCKTDLLADEDETNEGASQSHDNDDDSVLVGVFSFIERMLNRANPRTWWRRQERRDEDMLSQERVVSQQPLLEHNDGESLQEG